MTLNGYVDMFKSQRIMWVRGVMHAQPPILLTNGPWPLDRACSSELSYALALVYLRSRHQDTKAHPSLIQYPARQYGLPVLRIVIWPLVERGKL
jgi:hypothetical protein